MTVSAIIFDLDETLLDTSVVREARDRRDWNTVKAQLDGVMPFEVDGTVVHMLPAELRRQGIKVGIVTHAPGWYVDELRDRFGIRVDATITGSDGYPPKPDPTSIKALATALGVPITECAYVGDLDTDTAAAAAAGALAIGVCWSERAPEVWRRWWPDVAVSRPAHLLDVERLEMRGPLAEVLLGDRAPLWHWGTVMRVESGIGALGRYFTPEDIDRHPHHLLSHLVLAAKDAPVAAEHAARLFAALAERPSWRDARPELVLSVPPKPEQGYDRFGVIRTVLADALDARESADVLEMLHEVKDYKRMNHDERRAVNRGRFRSRALAGERVLLIDDVLTSGGQVEACRDALLTAGAARVDVIALAATQSRLPEACPLCGAHLRIIPRRDGGTFIGCPSFFTTGCPYTRDV